MQFAGPTAKTPFPEDVFPKHKAGNQGLPGVDRSQWAFSCRYAATSGGRGITPVLKDPVGFL